LFPLPCEANRLIRLLRKAGWSVERNGADHWCAEHPDGRQIFLASTPSRAGLQQDRIKVKKALMGGAA
jgi:predicted RNA binding protein YcfA (HicA-like mRNA interferase family)